MQIKFQVEGTRRKELVSAISALTGTSSKYKGPPSFAYAIGDIEVDRDGTIFIDDLDANDRIQVMLENLKSQGFYPVTEQDAIEVAHPEPDRLSIELPIDGFTETALSNLQQIIQNREVVIKAALGVDDLQIEKTDETLKFPWFDADTDGEHVKAYTHFITAICQMAKTQKRINASVKDTANEKYAFRCFLLRLGYIGPEYKATRKILLSKLEGSSAFRDGPHIQREAQNE